MTSSSLLLVAVLLARVYCSAGKYSVDYEQPLVGLVSVDSAGEVFISENVGNASKDINRGVEQKPQLEVVQMEKGLREWLEDGEVEEEGRHHKKRRKMLARLAVWLQALGLGLVLPSVLALALFAAWKGVTLSLMALMLAGIVGLKGLVASATRSSSRPQHVVLSGLPSHHQHYWKRSDHDSWGDSAHQLAYSAYS